MPKQLAGWTPTRRSLLSRLKQWDDQESWQDFFSTYSKLIYGVALRAGLAEAEAEDIVQETVISVARQMPNFRYDPAQGSFKSWLFLVTQRRIADHLRKRYRRVQPVDLGPGSTGGQTAVMDRIPDPAPPGLEAIWDEEWRHRLLESALDRVKGQVDAKHFQVFDCYVRKEWPVKDVATAFGIKPSQVYLIKHRVGELVATELKRLEANKD
jgi:RNA polymerase sigma-70 factor (ECF subfamily)